MELRDEDRRMSNPPTTYKPKPLHATPIVRHEACERCGREAEFFYIWNGRKLYKSCLDEEQKKWGMAGGGPTASATRVVYNRGRDGLLGSIIRGILVKIGLIKQEQALRSEIVSAEPIKVKEGEGKKKKRKKNVVSFRYGKPLSEALEEEEMEEESKGEAGEQRSPESEGLMKSKPKKMPKKKAKSKKKKAKPKKAKPKKK